MELIKTNTVKKDIIRRLLQDSAFESFADYFHLAKQMLLLSENTLKALDPKYEIYNTVKSWK